MKNLTPTLPPCDNCGARSWKVDADITHRSQISFLEPNPVDWVRIYVDLVDREPLEMQPPGGITCGGCGYDLNRDGDAGIWEAVTKAAKKALRNCQPNQWRVIDDYRQF